MNTTVSADGTKIAYDQVGVGPAVILVGGAFNSRTFGPNQELVPLLSEHFTVIDYDRRGQPGFLVLMMRLNPSWSTLKAAATTLPYDGTIVQDYLQGAPVSSGQWTGLTMPTVVLDGGKSPAWIRNAMQSLRTALPNATYQNLPGEMHYVRAKAIGPVLTQFFAGSAS